MSTLSPPTHFPTAEQIAAWPTFTVESPMRVLVSACLGGDLCGVDGTANGVYPLAKHLLMLPNVKPVKFCPENDAFGTPRATPDLEGGNGFAVLDGTARVVSDKGDEWTDGLVQSATKMRDLAVKHDVHLALMMDISACCGSTVIYDGVRSSKKYQRGPGVAGALMMRAGIPVVSQRDERTLARILDKLGAADRAPFTDRLDHYERDWYRGYFKGQ
jgi:uncharacterized protein YbbK (DUF523 family)